MGVTRRSFLRGLASGMVGAVAAGAFADFSGRNVRLERPRLHLPGWQAEGLRVGFITDIHVNDPDEMERARTACRLLADLSPDLMLFGGDCVNGNGSHGLDHISMAFEPLAKLSCSKLAVLGNHDYWSGVVDKIERRLEESGFRVLKNEVAHVDGYAVAGYDDRIGGRRDDRFQPDESSLLVLMHEGDHVDVVPRSACLQLSGHSHGGQICLPFGVPVHLPRLSRRYPCGFFPDAPVPLYVSRGVGTSGPKWRAFCPPEVTLLTLRRAR